MATTAITVPCDRIEISDPERGDFTQRTVRFYQGDDLVAVVFAVNYHGDVKIERLNEPGGVVDDCQFDA